METQREDSRNIADPFNVIEREEEEEQTMASPKIS